MLTGVCNLPPAKAYRSVHTNERDVLLECLVLGGSKMEEPLLCSGGSSVLPHYYWRVVVPVARHALLWSGRGLSSTTDAVRSGESDECENIERTHLAFWRLVCVLYDSKYSFQRNNLDRGAIRFFVVCRGLKVWRHFDGVV